jgi:hypothetical protein
MDTYAPQIEEGKQIVRDHAASLLPADVQLVWIEKTGEDQQLVADRAGRASDLLTMSLDDLADIPGDPAVWEEMKWDVENEVDDWKAPHLRAGTAA